MIKTDNKFKNEINNYSAEDLQLIYDTQKDLYSIEEMQIIEERLMELQAKGVPVKIKKKLPKTIICPKCDQTNPFENEICAFCKCKIDKRKYFRNDNVETVKSENSDDSNSHIFHYISSFLIPLIAFILGAILLSKEDEDERSVGKVCIILGVISVLIEIAIIVSVFR